MNQVSYDKYKKAKGNIIQDVTQLSLNVNNEIYY